MTPEQIAIVESTVARVEERLDAVAAGFYVRLFADAPETEAMFTRRPDRQREIFAAELHAMVLLIRDHPEFVRHARRLGARHREHGVRAAHYRLAGPHLIGALAAELADDWNDDTEEAWRLAYSLLSETMMAGAADAACDQNSST